MLAQEAQVRQRRAEAPPSRLGDEPIQVEQLQGATVTQTVKVPPHGITFLPMYIFFGVITSFGFGREPGTLPHDWFDEFKYPALTTCVFVVCFNLFDTLGVGRARAKHAYLDATNNQGMPEEVALALRAQANQVEQFPGFLAALWLYSFFVNGFSGGVMGSMWTVLRQLYSSTYRNSAGATVSEKGLGKFTLPCYFLLNAMAMGTVVHIVRFMCHRGSS